MDLDTLLARLGLAHHAPRARSLMEGLPADAPAGWRRLAAALAVRQAPDGRPPPRVLGIGGGQGAGKTTLSGLLVAALAGLGRRAVSLSLDDFYLTRTARAALARQEHPLLATRGVPGTHDVGRAISALDAIRAGRPVRIPVFRKAEDDRLPEQESRLVPSGVEVVIFEGWCVGARPQPDSALEEPVNDLERRSDAHGVWRRHVNAALAGDYQALWQRLDELLFLQVPDMAAVVRWRLQQEGQHPAGRRMDRRAVIRFVACYERLTRWMLETLPDEADLVGVLDEDHGLADLRCRAQGGSG